MKWISLFAFFFITSCASWTSVRIPDVDKPLSSIRRAIKSSLPLGTRSMSQEGKAMESHYFLVGKKKFLRPIGSKTRYYASVLIRGDRRPYSIEISVTKQIKGQRSLQEVPAFRDDSTDERLAELIRKRILEQLSKRREDLNIIDDFRVF
ncbi:MAG: hypothetical protein AAF202_10585 [Pseudomonadota bacterium]